MILTLSSHKSNIAALAGSPLQISVRPIFWPGNPTSSHKKFLQILVFIRRERCLDELDMAVFTYNSSFLIIYW